MSDTNIKEINIKKNSFGSKIHVFEIKNEPEFELTITESNTSNLNSTLTHKPTQEFLWRIVMPWENITYEQEKERCDKEILRLIKRLKKQIEKERKNE